MRTNSLIILVIAIVMGGVAAFLARNFLLSRTQEVATGKTIVVAARPLPYGTPLTDDTVHEVAWAAPTLPNGAFLSIQDLSKDGRRTTVASIAQDEPVLSSKVTGPGQRASLSTMIDKNMRAITIRVDDVRGVAGFILPGDRVDIVLIRTDYSDLLLQDVKVIAVDQISAEQKDRPVVAKAVTLEVTPQQAQKISLATDVGHLSLILRKSGDANVVMNERMNAANLVERAESGGPAPVQTESARVSSPPPDASVWIMRDLKSQEYKVVREMR